MIRVSCTKCRNLCHVDEQHAGALVRCTSCGETFAARPVESWLSATAIATDAVAATVAGLDGEPPPRDAAPAPPVSDLVFREEKAQPLSLERVPWAWVDRLMPAKPRNFVIAVAIIAATSWLIGLALAPARWHFLLSTEWQTQPFYLATHFLCLRLFVTCYTRNFLAAAAHTTMPAGEA